MTEQAIEYKLNSNELALLERVKTICITSREKFDEVGLLKVEIKKERDNKFQLWEDLRKPAYDSYQNILKNMKTELEPFDLAIKKCQSAMDDYATEQARKAREAQEKLEREAREKARLEQERILAQAIEAENKRKALLAEAEKARSEKEKEALKAKAEKIEAKQELLEEKASQVFAEPVFVPVETSKGTRQDIEVVVLDLKKLCEEIGKGNIPVTVIKVEEMKLKTWVKACNKKNGEVPGLSIREVCKTSVRK